MLDIRIPIGEISNRETEPSAPKNPAGRLPEISGGGRPCIFWRNLHGERNLPTKTTNTDTRTTGSHNQWLDP